MKCGDYNLRKGRKVKVYSVGRTRYMGIWEYEKAVYTGFWFSRDNSDGVRMYTPLFRQGKKKIHGYACWWIPLNVAKRLDKERK